MQGATPADFRLSITDYVNNAKRRATGFCVEFCKGFNKELVDRTPVITGTLRGSWYSDLNATPNPISGPRDPLGTATIARLDIVASLMRLGDSYYLANGAHYARFVEYGTGRMWPRAMVRSTIGMAGVIAEEANARLAGFESSYPVEP